MILFANYTQFVGANEQLKMFLGDIALWDNPVNFHKRVTGSTSPRYNLADGVELRGDLENLYRRVDGRKRTEALDLVVIDDIIADNDDLGYKNINTTDAQSYATLDEYRDIMLRHGSWGWNKGFEKTYQWEMQHLMLRILEMKKSKTAPKLPFFNKVSEKMFTSKNGIFYKHTGGTLPTIPMFEGRELTLNELSNLTIQKPQGFGTINDIQGVNAMQFFKT
jgi:hypothetical protein